MEKDLIQLKIDMTEVRSDIKHIKKGHEDLCSKVDDGFKILGDKIDNLDTKFSAKWVEMFLIWIARILGIAVLGALATLIWKSAVYFLS